MQRLRRGRVQVFLRRQARCRENAIGRIPSRALSSDWALLCSRTSVNGWRKWNKCSILISSGTPSLMLRWRWNAALGALDNAEDQRKERISIISCKVDLPAFGYSLLGNIRKQWGYTQNNVYTSRYIDRWLGISNTEAAKTFLDI